MERLSTRGGCLQLQRLTSPDENGNFLATDLAADGDDLYLLVPGIGVVSHVFVPDPTPTC